MSSSWIDRLRYALTFRLALWYAAIFVVSAALLFAVTYLLLERSLEARDRDLIRSTLERYATVYRGNGLRALDRAITADRVAGRHESLFVRVIGRSAEAIFFNVPSDWGGVDLSSLGAGSGEDVAAWTDVPSRSGRARLEVASIRLADGTLFQVGKSSEGRDELLRYFRSGVLIGLVSIVMAGLAGGGLLTYGALQPLRDLTGTVRTIVGTGRLDTRVPVRRTGDALEELSGLVNVMLDRIDALVGAMRGSLDNVAHDLRTPLARLRSVAERALQLDDPAAAREALALCLEETDRVSATLTTLMDISEAETGTLRLARASVDLSGVVRDAVALYADVAEEAGVGLACECAGEVRVDGDADRLRQVFANLIDNAVKYTQVGGRVRVSATGEGDVALVRVKDTGVGIPANDLPRIWERLFRGDRSRATRGLGLGLSLVKAIVQAHGGRVDVESTEGQGSTFTVRLPREHATGAPPVPAGHLSPM